MTVSGTRSGTIGTQSHPRSRLPRDMYGDPQRHRRQGRGKPQGILTPGRGTSKFQSQLRRESQQSGSVSRDNVQSFRQRASSQQELPGADAGLGTQHI